MRWLIAVGLLSAYPLAVMGVRWLFVPEVKQPRPGVVSVTATCTPITDPAGFVQVDAVLANGTAAAVRVDQVLTTVFVENEAVLSLTEPQPASLARGGAVRTVAPGERMQLGRFVSAINRAAASCRALVSIHAHEVDTGRSFTVDGSSDDGARPDS